MWIFSQNVQNIYEHGIKYKYIRKNIWFFLLKISRNICRTFLFKFLFAIQISGFWKLSIKVMYHTPPHLLEIAKHRVVGRGPKDFYFRLAYLTFTNSLFPWDFGVIKIIIISYYRLVSEAAVIVNYYHNFMNLLLLQCALYSALFTFLSSGYSQLTPLIRKIHIVYNNLY